MLYLGIDQHAGHHLAARRRWRCGAGAASFNSTSEDQRVLSTSNSGAITQGRVVHRYSRSLRIQRLADPDAQRLPLPQRDPHPAGGTEE